MKGSLFEKMKGNLFSYVILVSASILFLILEHITHIEFMFHLAAIPIEILVAVFIVEQFLGYKENQEKRRQLMYIKSYMFRSKMRNLFISNFAALKSPLVTIEKVRNSTLQELKQFLHQAEVIEYRSLESMEPIILEYVRVEHVWHSFLERAMNYNFEEIFHNMIFIIHFIYGVKIFKEKYPDRLFIHEASHNEILMKHTMKILGDGIRSFLDYAIELKEKQPKLFDEILYDYDNEILPKQ